MELKRTMCHTCTVYYCIFIPSLVPRPFFAGEEKCSPAKNGLGARLIYTMYCVRAVAKKAGYLYLLPGCRDTNSFCRIIPVKAGWLVSLLSSRLASQRLDVHIHYMYICYVPCIYSVD